MRALGALAGVYNRLFYDLNWKKLEKKILCMIINYILKGGGFKRAARWKSISIMRGYTVVSFIREWAERHWNRQEWRNSSCIHSIDIHPIEFPGVLTRDSFPLFSFAAFAIFSFFHPFQHWPRAMPSHKPCFKKDTARRQNERRKEREN